jgi:lipopolysaccharide transport system ATP-binding protein
MQVIKVENLSKLYHLGGAAHNSLRDAVMSFVKNPKRDKKRELWALHDINFDVKDGETLGIIGHNGAGKSTLLKILSRITKPTSGQIAIHGRVGSLLEVGTGFHNELSGRENIYLNGAILGMKRTEIQAKFDEIVAFSEVEKFLDTPVKHYSSGMYMRLAFSVAAHLDPEVLIVDEVLAVGDISFQKKCLNKMREFGASGRTVIFVSHDMSAITRICNRAIVLDKGQIFLEGDAKKTVRGYMNSNLGVFAERNFDKIDAPASEFVRLKQVRVISENGKTTDSHDIRNKIGIQAVYEVLQAGQILLPNFQVFNQDRVQVFTVQDVTEEWHRREKKKGEYVSTVWIPGNFMAEGSFYVNFAVVTYIPAMRIHFNTLEIIGFDIVDSIEGNTARGDFAGKMEGIIRPILEWETSVKEK